MPNNSDPVVITSLSTEMYYFDGSTGCKRCQAITGYYPTLPSKPHLRCQCGITRYRIAKRPPCYIQYFRPRTIITKQGRTITHTISNCKGGFIQPFSLHIPNSVSHNLDPNLVKACNFTPPSPTQTSATVRVDRGKIGKAEFYIMTNRYSLSVQRTRVCTQNGRTTKKKMPPIKGTYTIDVGVVVTNFIQTLCEAPLPRF